MTALRVFTKWVTVVLAVAAWIVFVPIVNLAQTFLRRLAGQAGTGPSHADLTASDPLAAPDQPVTQTPGQTGRQAA